MASSPRIDELKKKFDENPRRYFAPLANEYRKFGDLEQAIQLCRAYLPQQPGHMSGHIVFGQALFEAGKLDEAKGVFETALGLDPENLIALRHLGDIARAGGDTPGARAWYQRVLDADPRNEEIAAQIATIDAAPPVAPKSDAPKASSEMGGWGDINPETAVAPPAAGTAAPATPAVPAPNVVAATPRPELVDLSALDLRDSLVVPVFVPGAPRPAASAAPSVPAPTPIPTPPATEPEFEREGEGAFAPPSPEAAAARPAIGVERSEELDLRSAAAPDATHALLGEPNAPAMPEEARPPTPGRAEQSFGSSNAFGFEVMEFVPPPRESDPAPASDEGRAGFGVPFTGETNAKDETPAAFVTETMAELYLQQGFTQEALAVYRQLLAQNPRDEGLRDRVAALEKGSRSSVGAGAVSDRVYDEVQRRHAKEPETIRAFFANLMRRRVLQRYDDSGRAGHVRPDAVSPNGDGHMSGGAPDSGTEHGQGGEFDTAGSDSSPAGAAFIVPEGAAPPPGMAPGDEQRAEYRDDASAGGPSAAPTPYAGTYSPADQRDPGTVTPQFTPARNASVIDESRPPIRPATPSATLSIALARDATNITDLFGDAAVVGLDEQAARVLSGAFPAVEPKSLGGRPAERAKNELSLDNVFREADRKTGRTSGGFSFDQFFSDGSGGPKPAQRTTDPSGNPVTGPDSSPDDDVAQFNDWLSGLKKK